MERLSASRQLAEVKRRLRLAGNVLFVPRQMQTRSVTALTVEHCAQRLAVIVPKTHGHVQSVLCGIAAWHTCVRLASVNITLYCHRLMTVTQNGHVSSVHALTAAATISVKPVDVRNKVLLIPAVTTKCLAAVSQTSCDRALSVLENSKTEKKWLLAISGMLLSTSAKL